MTRKTNMVFGCSPYRGDVETNLANARRYARFIALCGYSPVMPHLMFPQFLDDSKADERTKGIELGVIQMKQCDEIWIFGTSISRGMSYEIGKAKDMNIVARLFDEECNEISPATLMVDDRLDYKFRKIVNGLKFV